MLRTRTISYALIVVCLVAAWTSPANALFCRIDSTSTDHCGTYCSEIGAAVVAIADKICATFGFGNCAENCQCCTSVDDGHVFTGLDLTPAPNKAWQGVGGRGSLMGEAALCLLRDLANPALGNNEPGTGIQLHRDADLDFLGHLRVTQHVGLLDFNLGLLSAEGVHEIGLCFPALGCVQNLTQTFTATLRERPAGLPPAGFQFYDWGDAWGLDLHVNDEENTLRVHVDDYFSVNTIVGKITVNPEFRYNTFLKAVRSPYGAPPQFETKNVLVATGYDVDGDPAGDVAAFLTDVTSVAQGATATANGILQNHPGDSHGFGGGWNSQLALGSREAEADRAIWDGTADPFPRPDFLSEGPLINRRGPWPALAPPVNGVQARKLDEWAPAGEASVKLTVTDNLEQLLPESFRNLPFFALRKLELEVEPRVRAGFASQFNVYADEALFQRYALLEHDGVGGPAATSVRLESSAEADASFDLKAAVHLWFTLYVGPIFGVFVPIPINLDPTYNLPHQSTTSTLFSGPAAVAVSERTPTGGTDFTHFENFHGDLVDGTAFIQACLTEQPPPPEPPPPAPTFTRPDPLALANLLQYPCNVCAYVDELRTACLPSATGGYDAPAPCPDGLGFAAGTQCSGHACPQPGVLNPEPVGAPCGESHGVACTIQNVPANHLKLRTLLAPVSQAALPPEKRWLCDSGSKIGCFDLCTYNSGDPTAATVTTSAVDNASLGGRCNGPRSLHPVPCAGAGDCDDHNPCTSETCSSGACVYTDLDGGTCDDGLFCDGADHCEGGLCLATGGNPCATASKCCSELADKCLPKGELGCSVGFESCDGADGSSCDDHNPCTSNDVCQQGYCRGDDNGTCPATIGDGHVGDGEQCDVHLDDRCPGHCGSDGLCHEDCANGLDDDHDGKIDCEDTDCQGIPCECLPIGRDPATIHFAKNGDRLTIHGSLAPCEAFDALPLEIAGVLTNADGVIHSFTLPAGSLVRRGPNRVEYRNPAAKRARNGIARVRIRERARHGGRMTFFIESYGDLSAADRPAMTFQFRIGDHVFINSATWHETAGGWYLQLPD